MRYCNPDKVGENIHNRIGTRIGMVSVGGWLTLTGEFGNQATDHDDLLDQGFYQEGKEEEPEVMETPTEED